MTNSNPYSNRSGNGFPIGATILIVAGFISLTAMICLDIGLKKYSDNYKANVIHYSEYPDMPDIDIDEDNHNGHTSRYSDDEYSHVGRCNLYGRFQVSGILSKHPFTMDIYISPDGDVSGTYWNVLYDIRLPVEGTLSSGGRLLRLSLGKGSTESNLVLERESDLTFTGTWGKNKRRVIAELSPGTNESPSIYDSNAIRLKVRGERSGTNATARLGEYFYYENQGDRMSNALRAETDDGLNYTLYTCKGEEIATITLEPTVHGMTGKMTDISGAKFNLREE